MIFEKYIDYKLGLEFYINTNINNDVKTYVKNNYMFVDYGLHKSEDVELSSLAKTPVYYKRIVMYKDVNQYEIFVIANMYFDNIKLDYKSNGNIDITQLDINKYKTSLSNQNFVMCNDIQAFEFDCGEEDYIKQMNEMMVKYPYNGSLNCNTSSVDISIPFMNAYIMYYLTVHKTIINVYELIRIYITKHFKINTTLPTIADCKLFRKDFEPLYDRKNKTKCIYVSFEYICARLNKTYSPILKEIQLFVTFKSSKMFDMVLYTSQYDYIGIDLLLVKNGKVLHISSSDGTRNSDMYLSDKEKIHNKGKINNTLNLKAMSDKSYVKKQNNYVMYDMTKVTQLVLSRFNNL